MTAACAGAVASESCADALGKVTPPSCVPAPGDVGDGLACGDDEQCKSGFCAIPGGSLCGTCAELPKPGDACISGSCGRNLTCVSGKCQAPGEIGATCDSASQPCEASASCFGGKCVAGGGPGATCDSNEKTAPSCDVTQGVFCNPTTHVCQKILEAKAGDACGYDFAAGSYSVCVAGAICRTSAGGFSGTCVAASADGATCNADAATGPGCLSPATCVSSVCKLSDPSSCK